MAKNKPIIWPWDFPRRGEILPLVLCIALALAFIFFYFKFHPMVQTPRFGFGPYWDCTNSPKSEPVCIKRPPPHQADHQ